MSCCAECESRVNINEGKYSDKRVSDRMKGTKERKKHQLISKKNQQMSKVSKNG